MASECVGHTTSCCCYTTDTLASCALNSYDDHSVLDLIAQEHEKDSKLSSSLPHRYACCAKCFAQCCIRLSACRLSFIFPLELCLQLCIHKLPQLIALCFLAVRVLNFVVKHVCFVGTLTFASFCNGLHVIKTSWSAFGCCRSCDELLPFRLGLHQSLAVLCPLVLKKLLGQLDWFSHLRFRVAIVLAAVCTDCIEVPADLHAQALVITPVEHMQHVLCRVGHRSQVFQLVGQLASNHTRCTVDRIIRAD